MNVILHGGLTIDPGLVSGTEEESFIESCLLNCKSNVI